MQIKGAIFDMDGTVVDSLGFWMFFWGKFGEKYLNDPKFVPNEDTDKKIRTMIFSDAMVVLKEEYSIDEDPKKMLEFSSDILLNFYKTEAKEKPGATEFLTYLKNKGVKMILASATDLEKIKVSLEATGLAKFFEAILSCAEIGYGKDKPNIYLEAMRILDLNADEICVFEDSYVALETAKKVGFKTVGLYDKNNFGWDRLESASDIYNGEDKTLLDLIPLVNA